MLLCKCKVLQALVFKMHWHRMEKRCIFKDSFTGHDTVNTRVFKTCVEVSNSANASICKDRDLDCLLDFLDDFPVCRADEILFVFFDSSVDCEDGAPSCFYFLDKFEGLLLCL